MNKEQMMIVIRARDWMKEREGQRQNGLAADSGCSNVTRIRYRKRVQALAKNCAVRTPEALLARARDTKFTNTWRFNAAALLAVADDVINHAIAKQDKLQRKLREGPNDAQAHLEFEREIKSIHAWLTLVQSIKDDGWGVAEEKRRRRHSKSKDLIYLRGDWRELLLERLPNYRAQFLVAAVTGCRASEIANGVTVIAGAEGLECVVKGRKVSETKGQPVRTARFDYGTPLIDALAALAKEQGGQIVVEYRDNLKGPRQFSNSMANAAKRLWGNLPVTVTPHMLRHQIASDMKAAGRGGDELAEFLGHYATATQQTYGHYRSGRGGVLPKVVSAARKPKETRKLFRPEPAVTSARVLRPRIP